MEATQKQLEFIRIIEGYVCEKFTGRTKKEASEYISKHYEEYTEIRKEEDEYLNMNNWAMKYGYF